MVEIDASGGRHEETQTLLLDADRLAFTAAGNSILIRDLRVGHRLELEDNRAGIVTAVTPYSRPRPARQAGPRVVARFRHVVRELLLLKTTTELIKTTPDHPFFLVGRGWTAARHLRPGNRVATAVEGRSATIVETRLARVPPTPVYNLTVEEQHVFHIGREKLLVHNDCGPRLGSVRRLKNAIAYAKEARSLREFGKSQGEWGLLDERKMAALMAYSRQKNLTFTVLGAVGETGIGLRNRYNFLGYSEGARSSARHLQAGFEDLRGDSEWRGLHSRL